jgi:hypothetical protein
MSSVITGNPPCSSIFIIMDVPERGRPDTTTMEGGGLDSLEKSRLMFCA